MRILNLKLTLVEIRIKHNSIIDAYKLLLRITQMCVRNSCKNEYWYLHRTDNTTINMNKQSPSKLVITHRL